MFVQGYVTVFLCLYDLGNKNATRMLRLTAFLKVWGGLQTCALPSLLRMYHIYFG